MLTIFEPPILITLIILFYFLFFFALFLTKLPRANGKPQKSVKTPKEVKESHSECTMFGFLQELPKGDPIPDECMSCQKLLECLLKKKAFDWYSGQNSLQKSEP